MDLISTFMFYHVNSGMLGGKESLDIIGQYIQALKHLK